MTDDSIPAGAVKYLPATAGAGRALEPRPDTIRSSCTMMSLALCDLLARSLEAVDAAWDAFEALFVAR